MNPFFQTDQITLYQGDCLEVMTHLPDNSIDFICTDLPYGVTACKWDKKLDLSALWEQYRRLIKPRGAVALFGTQPFTSELVMSNRKWFKYEWIWEKTMGVGGFSVNTKPMMSHENVVIFAEKIGVFNPQRLPGESYTRPEGKKTKSIYGDRDGGYLTVVHGGRCPKSVLKIANPNHGSVHPTQKPVPLLQYLIQTYTNEGDTVLDSTCGSGSTLVAARDTGRKAIGIELDPDYCKIAAERCQQLTIFGAVS